MSINMRHWEVDKLLARLRISQISCRSSSIPGLKLAHSYLDGDIPELLPFLRSAFLVNILHHDNT